MITDSKTYVMVVFVAIVMALVSVCVAVVYMVDLPSVESVIIYSFGNQISWTSVTMLLLFVYMHSKYYSMRREECTGYSNILVGTLLFGGMASFLSFAGDVSGLILFKSNTMILILAGFCCGPVVAFLSFVFVFTSMVLVQPFILIPDGNVYLLLIMGGIFGTIAGIKKVPGYTVWFFPLVVYLPYILLMDDLAPVSLYGEVYSKRIYLASWASMVLSGYYILTVHSLFKSLISDRYDLSRNTKDLAVAHDIQMAAVPTEFPNSRSLTIHATMEPAIEVGGDFYDCFTISRNLTVFIIADVSDKGLPASMLMMRMMGSFKSAAMLNNDPGKIFTAVNKELCRNNPADQFISAWMGIYDSDTGILLHSNAGHTPPYIRHGNGSFEKLEVKKGPIIGAVGSVRYKTSRIDLFEGDMMFLYTDGVNEAFNANDEQYGHERLVATLNGYGGRDPAGLIDSVYGSIRGFTSGCPVSDDITMMSFYISRPEFKCITVPGKVDHLDTVNGFIEETLTECGCPLKQVLKMEIVAEELFVNICDHAYEDKEGEVTVYCRYVGDEIKLTFADDAEYFNPINKEDIEIDDNVGNWPIGGFGIHMVKNLVTYMDYKYFAGKNIFTVWKRVVEPAGHSEE